MIRNKNDLRNLSRLLAATFILLNNPSSLDESMKADIRIGYEWGLQKMKQYKKTQTSKGRK